MDPLRMQDKEIAKTRLKAPNANSRVAMAESSEIIKSRRARFNNSNALLNNRDENEMISTEQAAAMMKCSRPYVAMLVDSKRLPGSLKTPGGHRKIPVSSVHAWMREKSQQQDSNADYKAAARDLGMYDVPEETYVKVLRRSRKGATSA